MKTKIVSREPIPSDFLAVQTMMNHLRLDDNYDVELLETYRLAAIDMAEGSLNKYLSETMLKGSFNQTGSVFLPWGNAQQPTSLTGIEKYDSTDTRVDVTFTYNDVTETIDVEEGYRDLEVEYQCGYPDGEIPKAIEQACLMIVGSLYKGREDNLTGMAQSEVPYASKVLLGRHGAIHV